MGWRPIPLKQLSMKELKRRITDDSIEKQKLLKELIRRIKAGETR